MEDRQEKEPGSTVSSETAGFPFFILQKEKSISKLDSQCQNANAKLHIQCKNVNNRKPAARLEWIPTSVFCLLPKYTQRQAAFAMGRTSSVKNEAAHLAWYST